MLQNGVRKAAEIIKKHEYGRVVSHYDADGVTSAGIICHSLLRRGMQFHATTISKLDKDFIQRLDEELVIFCDMGSAQLGLIEEHLKEKDVIILDHHVFSMSKLLPPSFVHINPHCIENTKDKVEIGDICAATIAYLLARRLGIGEVTNKESNIDLAGLAIAGALGDKLNITTGINGKILDEAIRKGVVSIKEGLKVGKSKIGELLLFSTDPYIELAGEPEKVKAFLDTLGIDDESNLSDLDEEKQLRLKNALLAMTKCPESLFGITYVLNFEVVKNSLDFMRMVDASGRLGKAGLGIGLCMREEKMLEEARLLYFKFQRKLISELKKAKDNLKETPNIFYFYVQEKSITGTLAGILSRCVYTSKPVIVLKKKEGGETKVSARCNKKLLSEGVDLAKAIEEAAKEAGGAGGGHPVASGASIPEGTEEEFIKSIDRIITYQKPFP